MVDLALPKPVGIPMVDATKTSAVPTTQTQPVQPAPAIPVDQAVDKAAREAEKFAWSPDQGKQVSGIMDTQRNEYNQRADRVAKNQMTQQTLTEIERVKGLIAAEVEAIRVLTGEISTINGEISKINSEISSTQSAIDSARAEVTSINSVPVTVASSTSSYSAPASSSPTQSYQAPPSSPGGGWIGGDYYDNVEAARAAANTKIDYNSPKERLKQELQVRYQNNEARRARLTQLSPASEWNAVTAEENDIRRIKNQNGIS
jgi:hypothetical protein